VFVDAIAVEDIGGWRYFGALPLADAAARVARIGLPVLTGSTARKATASSGPVIDPKNRPIWRRSSIDAAGMITDVPLRPYATDAARKRPRAEFWIPSGFRRPRTAAPSNCHGMSYTDDARHSHTAPRLPAFAGL
jgi:hypothetical protein